MQYNGEANSNDLVSDTHFLCGTDATSYPVKDITRNANFALDRVTALIMRFDKRWRWDDSNNTGVPIDYANLVSGTASYAVPVTYLRLDKVRIKDSGGNWVSLERVDRGELTDAQLTGSDGTPTRYYLIGNYIYFNVAPNYSSTNGIEYQFSRAPRYFTYTDTIATPGFAAQFHRLISLHTSRVYCEANDIGGRLANINVVIGRPPEGGDPGTGMEKELCEFYSARSVEEKPSMKLRRDDYGEGALGNDGNFSTHPDGF